MVRVSDRYATLYPTTLVEEYRRAVRGRFLAAHGPEAPRNPTAEEWQEFSRSCGLRDMGTHLCAPDRPGTAPAALGAWAATTRQPKESGRLDVPPDARQPPPRARPRLESAA